MSGTEHVEERRVLAALGEIITRLAAEAPSAEARQRRRAEIRGQVERMLPKREIGMAELIAHARGRQAQTDRPVTETDRLRQRQNRVLRLLDKGDDEEAENVLVDWCREVVQIAKARHREAKNAQRIKALVDALVQTRRAAKSGMKASDGRKRRKRASSRVRRITSKQAEAVQIVGECKGNLSEAARRLGKDRKTVKELYDAGMGKIAKAQTRLTTDRAAKTQSIPRDRRGQENVSADRREK